MKKSNQRWWDWPAAAFLILTLFCSASRLQTTNWTEYLGRIQILVLAAAGLGMLLGYSAFSGRFSLFYGALFSLVVPVWSLAVLVQGGSWLERVAVMASRLALTVGQLFSNQAVRDPIQFLFVMVMFYWLAAITAGYQLVRNGRPWGALIVPGVITLVVEYSFDMFGVADQGTFFSLLFLLFLVLLIARVYFLGAQREWLSQGRMVEGEVGFDLGRGAAIASVVLVVLAWYSPRVVQAFMPGTQEQRTLSEDIQRFRARFGNAVSALRSQAPLVVESLGDSLALGAGNRLGTDVVMYVSPSGGRISQARYYWAGRVYDSYQDDTWHVSVSQLSPLGPDAGPLKVNWKGRAEVSIEFLSRIAYLRTLFYPNSLLTLSRPTQGLSGPVGPDGPDIAAVVMDPPLQAGESYRVSASLSVPTIQMLQAASTAAYPEWVRARYLQVPERFSAQVQALAKGVTANGATQYEKTALVTAYLRENIVYESVLSAPPPAADPLEWFLFVHKAGFCNYYASAEVMMLRSIGIPARLVVGYAEGTWSDTEKRFEVQAKDFHAWPEVYFNDLGWVPFEPTAGQPALEYPEGGLSTSPSGGGPVMLATPFTPPINGPEQRAEQIDDPGQRPLLQVLAAQYGPLTAGLLVGALLAYGLYRILEVPIRTRKPIPVYAEELIRKRGWRVPAWLLRWAELERRTPMERQFASVGNMLRTWECPIPADLTPSEQVALLVGLVPEVTEQASLLLGEYHRAAYSAHTGDLERSRLAAKELRRVGYRAWLNRRSTRKSIRGAIGNHS